MFFTKKSCKSVRCNAEILKEKTLHNFFWDTPFCS